MKIQAYHRVLLVFFVILLASSLALYVMRQVYDLAIDFKENAWFFLPLGIFLLALSAFFWWVYRKKDITEEAEEINQDKLQQNIENAENLGVDMAEIKKTMADVEKRREMRQISLAIFGEVNTGKSSLISSLTKSAEIISAPTSGTTKEIARYKWKQTNSFEVILSDVPGRAEPSGDERGRMAFDEAMLADLIIYVSESDLSREQMEDLQQLSKAHKPLLLALNKADQLNQQQQEAVLKAVAEKCADILPRENIVLTSATKKYLVQVEQKDGSFKEEWREKDALLETLAKRLIQILKTDGSAMVALADTVLVGYLHEKVKQQVEEVRRAEAERIIGSYSRASVVTAMAAVVPGIEVIILSGVGYKMVTEINGLFGSPASGSTIDVLLKAAARQFSEISKLSLVIGGNVLKSFPGIGTVAGGVMHALAYGLIVRGIGFALLELLEQREELSEDVFKKKLDRYVVKGMPSKEEIYDLVAVIRAFSDKDKK